MVVFMVRDSLGQSTNQQCQSVRLTHMKKLLCSFENKIMLKLEGCSSWACAERKATRQREDYKHSYHSKQTYPKICWRAKYTKFFPLPIFIFPWCEKCTAKIAQSIIWASCCVSCSQSSLLRVSSHHSYCQDNYYLWQSGKLYSVSSGRWNKL